MLFDLYQSQFSMKLTFGSGKVLDYFFFKKIVITRGRTYGWENVCDQISKSLTWRYVWTNICSKIIFFLYNFSALITYCFDMWKSYLGFKKMVRITFITPLICILSQLSHHIFSYSVNFLTNLDQNIPDPWGRQCNLKELHKLNDVKSSALYKIAFRMHLFQHLQS